MSVDANIIEKQQKALIKTRDFIKNIDLNNKNLTGSIWNLLNDSNEQNKISNEEALKLKDNWSKDLIGELQRELVNYQLHQMKLGNPPRLFGIIKDVFNKINGTDNTILDIGCTSGYYYEIINFFYPNKFKYNGCDYNPESVKLATQYYPEINFFVDDLTNLSSNDDEYDITFLSGVIEHVPEYVKGLNELCRITKKYIVLHRIWLQYGKTSCSKGTQFFVPVIRNHYNKLDFFDILKKNSFMLIWESNIYDGNCKTYLLERV
jgi:SAM-dependent methyltransferase